MPLKKNYLLTTPLADRLYDTVKKLPLIDWHNHLAIGDLIKNRMYENLTELWLASDPYKHRAMRICGVPEQLITGDVSPYEKFRVWSRVLPQLAGNPLYDWSRLELQRVFGIEEELKETSAEKIWKHANELLKKKEYTARGLLEYFQVEYTAPCMGYSDKIPDFSVVKGIVPSLRGDDLPGLNNPVFQQAASLTELRMKLFSRLKEFHAAGCRFVDQALDAGFIYVHDDGKNEKRFAALKQGNLSVEDRSALACGILRMLGELYAELGWTLQLHIGAQRRTSSRLYKIAGPAGGYAGIGHSCDIRFLIELMDDLEQSYAGMPRMIIYTLNPCDHAMFAVLSGSFPGDGERGKVTLGPAWWFCDHIYGMRDCFENVAAYGVLSVFPGMTTDSRSLLSFVRHEYFRRTFCAWLADKACRDEMPSDFAMLKELAEKVCYYNAKAIINKGVF